MSEKKDLPRGTTRTRHPKKELALKVGVLIGSLVLTLLVAEVVCRMLRPTSDVAIATSVRTESGRSEIQLIPDAEGLHMGERVSINSDGYRGTLRPREKPTDVIRLSVYGDSHTFGVGADDEGSYPAQLERILIERTGVPYEVLNFGVGGHDLQSIMDRAERHAFEYGSDVVLITFHQGDLLESGDIIVQKNGDGASRDAAGGEESARPGLLYRVKTALVLNSALAQLVLPRVLGIVRSFGVAPQGVTAAETNEVRNRGPVWRQAVASLEDLDQVCRDRGARLAVVCFPSMSYFDDHQASELHRLIGQNLREVDIPVLDLLSAYQGHNPKPLQTSIFDAHPNAQGYGIAARAVADFVINLATSGPDGASIGGAPETAGEASAVDSAAGIDASAS